MRLFLIWLCLATVALARPWVVAHRGGTALGAENSMATFEKAIALGVDAIELDIHSTRDGDLAVIHDVTLDRTVSGRSGRVDRLSAVTLRSYGVPMLGDVLDLAKGRCKLFVEIKHPQGSRHQGIEKRLVEELRRHGMLDQVMVISFDAESLRTLRELEPKLPTGWLTGKVVDLATVEKESGADYAAPHYGGVDEAFVSQVHQAGRKISVWTVNEREAMEKMGRLDLDAITTDNPELLLEVLRHLEP